MPTADNHDQNIRIASDVGGTFTDSLAYDEANRLFEVSKVPTTPDNRALGTVTGLQQALQSLNRSGADVSYVGHGMTTATNTIIQRSGAHVAFITNDGFRDMLEIGRQNRPRLYDYRVVRSAPIARRADRYTISGRLDYTGSKIQALDPTEIKTLAQQIKTSGAEAVAVCLLHAYANPAHEQTVKQILEQELGDVFVCISTDIIREFREYERASTVALNAYLIPVMDRYLGSLETLLMDAENGLGIDKQVPVMVMEASGGLMTVTSARKKPVHTVLSGPAGGVVASADIARRIDINNIITMDMGGTSTDISLIIDGNPQITSQASLEGMPIRVPVVDINAIGAGGGSIASIDEGGALRVGPNSAEAVPGPACYRRGGTQATVTDANLVLGRLGADTALGGELTLDHEAAEAVIRRNVAEPLGIDVISAAAGIIRVANANMERGIRVVSVERGHDPREFVLVPFGGAGPLHSSAVAVSLNIPRVMIPPAPGILCAMGMLMSDLRHDLIETQVQALADLDQAALSALFAPLITRADKLLQQDGVSAERRWIETILDMRYIGQSYELMVPFGANSADPEDLMRSFHELHQQKFGHADNNAPIEIVNLRVLAIGKRAPFELPKLAEGADSPLPEARSGERTVYFDDDKQWHRCPIWRREKLLSGNQLSGPAVIEEVSSTTLLHPGDSAWIDQHGNILIDIAN